MKINVDFTKKTIELENGEYSLKELNERLKQLGIEDFKLKIINYNYSYPVYPWNTGEITVNPGVGTIRY